MCVCVVCTHARMFVCMRACDGGDGGGGDSMVGVVMYSSIKKFIHQM